MNPFTALEQQPPALQSLQLLLMGVFLTSYLAAVTSLLEANGRLRAAWVALAAGVGMGFVFTPWTLGALIAAGSVGAVGLFIGASWLLSRALGVHEHATTTLLPELEEDLGAPPVAPEPRARGRFAAPTAPAPLA
ncbi:MAG: hypothetical protein JSR75_00440 [Proteobacteria bacterium]|nr:hypothetical protein [Pseudomonadota bacterium]